MKTATYTIGNGMKSVVASLIILASFSGIAKGEYSNKETVETGTALQIEAYNAKEFVEADLANETDYWMNSNNEAVEAETTTQIEEYNAKKFVEAELALETESWMNGNKETISKVAEPELALHVEAYDAKEFVEAELSLETESWMNNSSNCIGSEQPFNYSNELANN